jgi:hypothetical protein
MKYILKGCFSARGFERIKDGDEIPVGWFDEITMEKMIKKGTIIVLKNDDINDIEDMTLKIENENESEMQIGKKEIELEHEKEEIFENKKKGIRRK